MADTIPGLLATLRKRATLWQAARILIASALSYGATTLFELPEGYWALITVIVVTQPLLKETLAASGSRLLGTLIGALAGVAVVEGAKAGWPVQPLFWIAMVPLALLTAAWPTLRVSCITLVILSLIPSSGQPIDRALDRVVEILLGVVVSIAVLALLPEWKKSQDG
ncbi:MAG TPA: FUSC family protein [Steroidobacteraceae bacterium]